jgi:uncharacterized OB-fold protein
MSATTTAHAESADPGAGPSGLLGTHCATCGRSFYPARDLCPTCWADDLPPHRLPATGTIATWSVVRMGKSFPTPYALCYADFDGDVRVLGRVTNWEDGRGLRPGTRVHVHPVEEVVDGRRRTVEHTFTVDPADLED